MARGGGGGGASKPSARPTPKPSRGGAKAGAKVGGAKPGGAKPRQPVKKAAPNGQARKAQPPTFSGKDAARLQMERSWWAEHSDAKDHLASTQGHAMKSEAVGTILNGDRRLRWRTSHATGAIFFLLLALFTTAMAVGSQNLIVAIMAFVCVAFALVFVTIEFAARRFPDPVPRPHSINQTRVEDLLLVDDIPGPRQPSEPGGRLDDLFTPETPPAPASGPGASIGVKVPQVDLPKQEEEEKDPIRLTGESERREKPRPVRLPDNLTELMTSGKEVDIGEVTGTSTTLVVEDLDRSLDFYTRCLGLDTVDRTSEAAVVEAGFGNILLWQRPDAPSEAVGVMHLTFEVNDVQAAFDRMNEAGVSFLHRPRTALLGEHYELKAAGFRDPDGHGLAITEHRRKCEA
ncbi:VOC family protein [Haloglycomyces albus]|uniref:VOC family protein n=1 Tax=Haloglycomyces albus TaxID=526067 RepID=UPI00046D10D9|nr:VOC family protein [Haloglycomyces albus]